MGDTIKARKGMESAIDTLQLAEFGYTLDEERVYIGGVTGNVPLPNKLDIDSINTKLTDIDTGLNTLNVVTPTVAYGMNNVIKNIGKISVSPKFTIQGKTIINLLGKDGNCENVSVWGDYQCTHVLDSTNKVFGSNGMKITLNSTSSQINSRNIYLTSGNYYFLSAYVKNGNATNITLAVGGRGYTTTLVTNTTGFTRIGIPILATGAETAVIVVVNGSSGQYAYVDGIMVNEITATEYALGTTALLANYPYVDSYSCLQNPYVEVRHDNLVRNGNGEEGIGWWTPYTGSSLSIVNNRFNVTTTSNGVGVYQDIKVKSNTSYYINGNVTGNTSIVIYGISDSNTLLISGNGSFNSGIYTTIRVYMFNSLIGTGTADSIMLVEGSIAPTSYVSSRVEKCVIEGKFTSDDSFIYENGKISGLKNWRHPGPLFGKDYDWQFGSDGVGLKQILLPSMFKGNSVPNSQKCVKYDGEILTNGKSSTSSPYLLPGADYCDFDPAYSNPVQISISDSDTGWVDSIIPNADEVKAFMNGWKAITVSGGGRYIGWISVLSTSPGTDISNYPTGVASTLSVATTGTTSVTVADASRFSVGDSIAIYGNPVTTISSIAGNVVTVAAAQSAQAIGVVVLREDNGTTDIRTLTYCKNNVAPGYDGYQLHYKLANAESITDINTHIHGDIPKFDVGDNYLNIDSGIVLSEINNPWSDGTNVHLNKYGNGFPSATQLKNKVEVINQVYKNNVSDIQKWTPLFLDGYGYGNERMYVTIASGSYDSNATYTVDYKILATQAPQIGSLTCNYSQDMISTITNLEEQVNSRQEHDSALDNIIDLSMHESSPYVYLWGGRAMGGGTGTPSIYTGWQIIPKKTIPRVTLSYANAYSFDNNSLPTYIPISDILLRAATINRNYVLINAQYIGTNTIIKSNIFAYGFAVTMMATFDCTGRA